MKKVLYFLLITFMIFSTIGTAFANTAYYQVTGNSMNPVLQDGDWIEIVSEEYEDGDMVVAKKKDGTKIVKRLMGDRLVSVGDGTSYSVNEVTILGAAKYLPMSMEELAAYGFSWESVLGEGVTIVQVAGGSAHSLALTNTGEVYAWGSNNQSQLGDGTTTISRIPVKVSDGAMGNTGITSIAAGGTFSLAIKNGEVYAWGSNGNGQLGDGTTTISSIPVKVSDGAMGNTGITSIAAGNAYSLAIKNGEVYAWGSNMDGQLGDGTMGISSIINSTPVKVSDGAMGNTGITSIAAGHDHSLAIKNGEVYGWGYNFDGQLGDGTNESCSTPVKVSTGEMNENTEITSIVAGFDHSLALTNTGEVYAWGKNEYGQLGNGSTIIRRIPVKVSDGEMGNTGITSIAAGYYHSLAIKNGEVYAWGRNQASQLGDGTSTDRATPVKVSDGEMGNTGIMSIAAGYDHSLAIKNGEVYAWGRNGSGRLGDGTTTHRNTPVKVIAATPAITTQPTGATVSEGALSPNLVVQASSSDSGTITYQWYSNTTNSNIGGTPISGATSASYQVPTNTPGTLFYYVVVTNTSPINRTQNSSVTSSTAGVTVNAPLPPPPADPCEADLGQCEPPIPADPCQVNPGQCAPPIPADPCQVNPSQCAPPIPSSSTGDSSNSSPSSTPVTKPITPTATKDVKTTEVNVTIIKDENGVDVMVVKVDSAELKEKLAESTEAKAFVIQVESNSGKSKAVLQVGDLEAAATNNKENVFIAQADGAEYVLPATLVNKYDVASGLGISEDEASNAEVELNIEEKPASSVQAGKSKVDSKVIDFSITVKSGDNEIEINNFGNTYVDRTFDVTGSVNTNRAVGVVVNANEGLLSPVPTEFAEVDGKKVAVLKRNSNSTYTVVVNDVSFTDLENHWAKENILLLGNKLIVNGYEDGSFKPQGTITRGEFVTIIARSLGLDTTNKNISKFSDVKANNWYAGALKAVTDFNLVNGYEDGTFKANEVITRQDAAVIIARVIEFLELQNSDEKHVIFKDGNQISNYAKNSVGVVTKMEIIKGYEDNSLKPLSPITRAETVKMIETLLEHANFISK